MHRERFPVFSSSNNDIRLLRSLSSKPTISISMHREVGRWWRGLPAYRFASLGAAESRGNKSWCHRHPIQGCIGARH